ncbi:MAG: hypothetical protein K6F73_10770 [Lachnospiraceae bacterium]|nr:hypothetical protein [Lachnospiraceae bacterium]
MDKINKAEDKIIFVVVHPYALRDHKRFGAAYLMEQGYNVEIWRIMDSKSVSMDFSAGMYEGKGYRELSQNEYINELKSTRDKAFFIFQGKPDPIYPAAKMGCRYVIMNGMCAVPVPDPEDRSVLNIPAEGGIESRLQRLCSSGITGYIKSYIHSRLTRKKRENLTEKTPPALVVSSTHCAAKQYLTDKELSGNVLYTHALDYDRFIEANRADSDRTARHIVYCDGQMFVKGYDAVILGIEGDAYKRAKEYYSQLEKLFERLEEHYGLPVVIAGSPHLKYDGDSFCGRKLYFNQTCELTRNAALFIVTTTTAMNFPALYDVPVLKIANSSLKTTPLGKYADTYAYIKDEADQIFGCGFLDLDDEDAMSHPWEYVKPMDRKKRDKFIEEYLIDNDTEDKTVMECVEAYLCGRA